MNATEQYFPVVLFIMLNKVVQTFESVDVTIQSKAAEQHVHVVLFIIKYRVAVAFESEDEILECDHPQV